MLRSDIRSASGSVAGDSQSAAGSSQFRSRSPRSHYAQSTATSFKFKSVSAVLPIASPFNEVRCCTFASVANSDAKLRVQQVGSGSGSRRGSVASMRTAASNMTPAQVAQMVADPHYVMGSDTQPLHLVTGGKHGVLEVRSVLSGLSDAAVPEKGAPKSSEIGKKLGSLVITMCYSPQGHIWCGYSDGTIRVYDLTSAPMEDGAIPGMSQPLVYLPDDHGTNTSRLLYEAHRHSGPVTAIVHSSLDSASMVGNSPLRQGAIGFAAGTQTTTSGIPPSMFTCGADWKILRWHMTAPFGVAGAVGSHALSVRSLCVTASMLISGGDDHVIRLWPFHLLEKKQTLEGHTSSVVCMLYHRSMLWSGSEDGTVRVWNIDGDRSCAHTLIAHQSHVVSIRPVDSLMYTADKEGVIVVWELTNYEVLHCFRHTTLAAPVASGSGAQSSSGSSPSTFGKRKPSMNGRDGPVPTDATRGAMKSSIGTSIAGPARHLKKESTGSATSSNTFYIHDVKIVANVKGSIAWFLTTDGVRLAFLPSRPVEDELERRFGPELSELDGMESEDIGATAEEVADMRLKIENYEMREQRQYDALQDLQAERDEYAEYVEMVCDEFIDYTFKEYYEHSQRMTKLFNTSVSAGKDDVIRTNDMLQHKIQQLEAQIKDQDTRMAEKSKLLSAANAKFAKATAQHGEELTKLHLEKSKLTNDLKHAQFELRGAKDTIATLESKKAKEGKESSNIIAGKAADEAYRLRQELHQTKEALEKLRAEADKQTAAAVALATSESEGKETKKPTGPPKPTVESSFTKELKQKLAKAESDLLELKNRLKNSEMDRKRLMTKLKEAGITMDATPVESTPNVSFAADGQLRSQSSQSQLFDAEMMKDATSIMDITPLQLAKGDETIAQLIADWIQEQQQSWAERRSNISGTPEAEGKQRDPAESPMPAPAIPPTDALLELFKTARQEVEALKVKNESLLSGGIVGDESPVGKKDSSLAANSRSRSSSTTQSSSIATKDAIIKQLRADLVEKENQIAEMKKRNESERGRINQLQNAVSVLKEKVTSKDGAMSKSVELAEDKVQAAFYDGRRQEREMLEPILKEKDAMITHLREQLELARRKLKELQRKAKLSKNQLLDEILASEAEGVDDPTGLDDVDSDGEDATASKELSSIQALSRELDIQDRRDQKKSVAGDEASERQQAADETYFRQHRRDKLKQKNPKVERLRALLSYGWAQSSYIRSEDEEGTVSQKRPLGEQEMRDALRYAGVEPTDDVMEMLQEIAGGSPNSPTTNRARSTSLSNSRQQDLRSSIKRNLDEIEKEAMSDDELTAMIEYLDEVKRKLKVLEQAVATTTSPILRDGALIEIHRLHQALQERIERRGLTAQLGGLIDIDRSIPIPPKYDPALDPAANAAPANVTFPQGQSSPNARKPRPKTAKEWEEGWNARKRQLSPSKKRGISPPQRRSDSATRTPVSSAKKPIGLIPASEVLAAASAHRSGARLQSPEVLAPRAAVPISPQTFNMGSASPHRDGESVAFHQVRASLMETENQFRMGSRSGSEEPRPSRYHGEYSRLS